MKVLLTGGGGMLGRNLLAEAGRRGIALVAPSRGELDLADAAACARFFRDVAPDVVIHAAARVGGIQANMRDQAGFLADNLVLGLNVVRTAAAMGVRRLVNIASSCMYPRDHRQPLREEDVLAAPLEPTNEGYALAKIACARLCAYLSREQGLAYRTILPCNLYGPHDHFGPERSHLVAACLHKLHQARAHGDGEVVVWGDGTARREFLYVGDLAAWILDVLPRCSDLPDLLNVGAGDDHSVADYYRIAAEIVGWGGHFSFDTTRPVGMRRKLMDSTRAAAFGWRPVTDVRAGMRATYDWYLANASAGAAHA